MASKKDATSWGVELFVRTALLVEMQYTCVRVNASTPYDGMNQIFF